MKWVTECKHRWGVRWQKGKVADKKQNEDRTGIYITMIKAQTLGMPISQSQGAMRCSDWSIAKQNQGILPEDLQIITPQRQAWLLIFSLCFKFSSIIRLETKPKWPTFAAQHRLLNWPQSLITTGGASSTNNTSHIHVYGPLTNCKNLGLASGFHVCHSHSHGQFSFSWGVETNLKKEVGLFLFPFWSFFVLSQNLSHNLHSFFFKRLGGGSRPNLFF